MWAWRRKFQGWQTKTTFRASIVAPLQVSSLWLSTHNRINKRIIIITINHHILSKLLSWSCHSVVTSQKIYRNIYFSAFFLSFFLRHYCKTNNFKWLAGENWMSDHLLFFLFNVHRFKCNGLLTFETHCNIPTLETQSVTFFKLPPLHYCISWPLISERPNKDDEIGAANVRHVYLTFQSPCLFLSPALGLYK